MFNSDYFRSETQRLNHALEGLPEHVKQSLTDSQIEQAANLFKGELKKLGISLSKAQGLAVAVYIEEHPPLDVRLYESYFVAYNALSSSGELERLELENIQITQNDETGDIDFAEPVPEPEPVPVKQPSPAIKIEGNRTVRHERNTPLTEEEYKNLRHMPLKDLKQKATDERRANTNPRDLSDLDHGLRKY